MDMLFNGLRDPLHARATQRMSVTATEAGTRESSVYIYKSELQAMCRNALAWGGKETGGQLYGAYRGNGIAVVMLATPPGPNAQHRVATFVQDIDYCRTADEYMHDTFGICLCGRWHSHHRYELPHPSDGDRKSASSLISKNTLPTFVEIIITTNPEGGKAHVNVYQYLS